MDQFIQQNSESELDESQQQIAINCNTDNDLMRAQDPYKRSVINSIKHLLNILIITTPYLIAAFVAIILVVAIQVNSEIDSNCNLKEYYYKNNDRCPSASYLIIAIRDIIFRQLNYFLRGLPLMNTYQFNHRRLTEYILLTLSLGCNTYRFLIKEINTYRVLDEYTILMIVFCIIISYISKHNMGILIYRIAQVLLYMILMLIGYHQYIIQRDTKSFFSALGLQYFSIILKKVSQIYLYYRLENHLYYDDISIYYISTISVEYTYVFYSVLIVDNSTFQKVITVLNFIVIQTQNITDNSLFYYLYKYIKNNKYLPLKTLVFFQYFVMASINAYQLLSVFTANLYLWICFGVIMKVFHRFISRDNQIVERRHIQSATVNGYFEQRIDKSEIDVLMSQQSLIAFFVFQFYQILLIIVKTSFPENGSGQYLIISQIKEHNNNLNIQNVLIFNAITFSFTFILVVVRERQKGLKIVKQPTRYQIILIQFLISVTLIHGINKRLFEPALAVKKLQF